MHHPTDIFDLANSLHLRQRVAATASVYLRRVYATSAFARHDPRVVAPGCLYLASKVEESVVSARALVAAARRLRPAWPADLKLLLDAEMVSGGVEVVVGGVGGSVWMQRAESGQDTTAS